MCPWHVRPPLLRGEMRDVLHLPAPTAVNPSCMEPCLPRAAASVRAPAPCLYSDLCKQIGEKRSMVVATNWEIYTWNLAHKRLGAEETGLIHLASERRCGWRSSRAPRRPRHPASMATHSGTRTSRAQRRGRGYARDGQGRRCPCDWAGGRGRGRDRRGTLEFVGLWPSWSHTGWTERSARGRRCWTIGVTKWQTKKQNFLFRLYILVKCPCVATGAWILSLCTSFYTCMLLIIWQAFNHHEGRKHKEVKMGYYRTYWLIYIVKCVINTKSLHAI